MKGMGMELCLWAELHTALISGRGRKRESWESFHCYSSGKSSLHLVSNRSGEHYSLQSISGGFYLINSKSQC